MLQHFIHDTDLKLIIKYFVQELNENVSILKKELSTYKVIGPSENRVIGPPPCNIEMYTDEFIAGEILIYIQGHIENMLRMLRTSMTNDDLRTTISKMAKETINREPKIVSYMAGKGWVKMCPRYNNVPSTVAENISAAEAYHLWDHLCYRYDNIQQTRLLLAYVHDLDFKIDLEDGINTLSAQVKTLEKEIKSFGIVAPKKPSDVTIANDHKHLFNDDHIYRIILIGQQGASVLHAQSFKQCTLNMRVKEIFRKLLMEEIDILGRYIRFGKLKGWLNPSPSYQY